MMYRIAAGIVIIWNDIPCHTIISSYARNIQTLFQNDKIVIKFPSKNTESFWIYWTEKMLFMATTKQFANHPTENHC